MSTNKAWKARERSAASYFGTTRQPGSGSWAAQDGESSDARHARLHIEVKLRARHPLWTLWHAVRERKKKAKDTRITVLMIGLKDHPGHLVACHEDDLLTVAMNRLVALPADQRLLWYEALEDLRDAAPETP